MLYSVAFVLKRVLGMLTAASRFREGWTKKRDPPPRRTHSQRPWQDRGLQQGLQRLGWWPETRWDEGVLRGEAAFLHSSGCPGADEGHGGLCLGVGLFIYLCWRDQGPACSKLPNARTERDLKLVGLPSSTICFPQRTFLHPHTRSNIEKPKPSLTTGQRGLPRSAAGGLATQVHSIWERGHLAAAGNSAGPGVRNASGGAETSP